MTSVGDSNGQWNTSRECEEKVHHQTYTNMHTPIREQLDNMTRQRQFLERILKRANTRATTILKSYGGYGFKDIEIMYLWYTGEGNGPIETLGLAVHGAAPPFEEMHVAPTELLRQYIVKRFDLQDEQVRATYTTKEKGKKTMSQATRAKQQEPHDGNTRMYIFPRSRAQYKSTLNPLQAEHHASGIQYAVQSITREIIKPGVAEEHKLAQSDAHDGEGEEKERNTTPGCGLTIMDSENNTKHGRAGEDEEHHTSATPQDHGYLLFHRSSSLSL